MKSPYLITEPTLISFSGGRSSAYMLHKTLLANNGLPDESVVVFANTGKEMEQTLDFVQSCSDNWSVPITWVELGAITIDGQHTAGRHKGKNRYRYITTVVDHATASRNGEPFERLVMARKMPPNVMMRFCTSELKIRRMQDISPDVTCHFVGIRHDEARRAVKMHNKEPEKWRVTWCPMWLDGTTKETVSNFWKKSPFDLALPNDNGTTVLGNCDLCFLKGKKKRISIAQQYPDLVTWWAKLEERVSEDDNRLSWFDKDMSYKELSVIASNGQTDIFGSTDIPCFCGD